MAIVCKKCDTKLEMYYKQYCPKCDIQEMIKEEKTNAVVIFPVLNYGEQFIEGFYIDVVWDRICQNDNVRNDTYVNYNLRENEGDNMLKMALDELKIPYENNKVFLWISW